MKERVLFVDDEQNILNGLRRMLRSQRTNWDLYFANSGPKALELMQSQEVDIVVSDMKMPGMDGAELLSKISEDHPNTIRVILSGYADKEAVLRTIGPAHQYLAKPCDRELLLNTVKRSLDLRKLLASESLRTIVNGLDTLPTPSNVFDELIHELTISPSCPKNVVKIIESDISLSANFLKLTNSAYFGSSNNQLTLADAVRQLGTDTIKAIVMIADTFHPLHGSPEDLLDINELGQFSILTGRLSKAIAKALNLEHRLVDQSYIAGTLSQVGAHLLLTKHTKKHQEIQELVHEQGAHQSEASRKILGASFGEVGGYLLGIWGFTDPIIEAVVFQSEPSACAADSVSPLTCVHLAQYLMQQPSAKDTLDQAYIDKLGLTDKITELTELLPARTKQHQSPVA